MTSSSRRIFAGLLVVLAALVAWFALRGPASSDATDVDETKASSAAGFGTKRAIGSEVEAESDARSKRPWNTLTSTITGRVHDEKGAAILGAMVCARIAEPEAPTALHRTPKCSASGKDGHYTLDAMMPISVFVSASAPTFIPGQHEPGVGRRRTIKPKPGAALTGIDIELRGGGVEIHGIVKDVAGGVIEGAQVGPGASRWFGGSNALGFAVTDAEGAFSLWVAPGDTRLEASADGYASSSRSGKTPGYTFEIVLTPESVVGGRVVDAQTGAPVVDAFVEINSDSWGSSQIAYSDGDGRFRVDRLEPGRYTVAATTANRHGTSNESRRVGLGEVVEEIDVRVFPAASIAGHVSIAGDEMAPCETPGVTVVGRTTQHQAYKGGDNDGFTEVHGLPPDTYDIDVNCEGFVSKPKYEPVVLADAPVTGLSWEVDRGLSIVGIVVDAKGAPVANASVTARQSGAAARAKRNGAWGIPSGKDGRFTLDGLIAATYDVDVSHDEHLAPETPTSHTLTEGKANELVLKLESGGGVRGRVVDAKQRPVSGALVQLTGTRRGGNASTGDDGTFTIENVRPGEHRVKASTGGWDPMRAPGTTDDDLQGAAVEVRAGEVAEVELVVEEQFGGISGTVVDADGGPVDDAFVSYSRESDSAKQTSNRAKRSVRFTGWGDEAPVLTETSGGFTLTRIPLGKHTLIAQRKGGGEGMIEHVETGSTGVVIRLSEGEAIGGKVVIAGGGAPHRFSISASDDTQGVSRTESFHETEGAWRISDLPPGKYVVAVSATEGAANTTITLEDGASRDDIELTLMPRVDVSGTVVDLLTGEPVPNMMVTITPLEGPGGFSFSDAGEKEHVSDASGNFLVRGAPTGAARIMIIGRNFGMDGPNYGWTRTRTNIPADKKTFALPPIRIAARRIEPRGRAGDLGFSIKDVPPEQEAEDTALEVAVIRPGGPASKSELKIGDVIVEVDGHDVTGDNRYVYGALTQVKEGVSVTLGLAGGGKVIIVAGKPV